MTTLYYILNRANSTFVDTHDCLKPGEPCTSDWNGVGTVMVMVVGVVCSEWTLQYNS